MPGPGDSTGAEQCGTVPDVVVFSEVRREMIDTNFSPEIGVRRVFAKRKLTLRAAPAALNIGLGAIKTDPLEGGRYDVFVDGAGGA